MCIFLYYLLNFLLIILKTTGIISPRKSKGKEEAVGAWGSLRYVVLLLHSHPTLPSLILLIPDGLTLVHFPFSLLLQQVKVLRSVLTNVS